ncbi:MAG: hypothetical protein JNL01_07410 [Bdellovibrionales bacterium]|nr:hypothetical protein [Bdellovibrionales bacterium]
MKIGTALTWIFLMTASSPAWAGGYVGNGGDGIVCTASPDNDLNGTYALDYVLTRTAAQGDDGLAVVKSWQDSSQRILKILQTKVPGLVSSFQEFTRLVFNTDYSLTRVWEAAPFGLTDLNDQKIASLIPPNCMVPAPKGAPAGTPAKIQVIQAIIRLYQSFSGSKPGYLVYRYFPQVIADLDRQAPVQLSFLMVHEWLWDLSTNVERNRRINRFLHSRDIETMTAAQVQTALSGMGLTIPGIAADPFSPDSCQGYALTEKDVFDRYGTGQVMANLGQLKVSKREKEVSCIAGSQACSPGWTDGFDLPIWKDNRFFLSPSYTPGDLTYPIRWVSPEIFQASGIPLLPGRGQVACKFITPTATDPRNLECKITDWEMIYPLFRLQSSSTPVASAPTFKGLITEECARFETLGFYRYGGSYSGEVMVQTVLSNRFTWKR